jgi:phage-related protein
MRSAWRLALRSLEASIPVQGPGVLEVVVDHRSDTYRAVYTVKFERAIYVLHAFQKKSPKRRRTAQTDVELISRRFRAAADDYEARYGERKKERDHNP